MRCGHGYTARMQGDPGRARRQQARRKVRPWLYAVAMATLALSLALSLFCMLDLSWPPVMLLSVMAPLWPLIMIVACLLLRLRGLALPGAILALGMLWLIVGAGLAGWSGPSAANRTVRIVEFNVWTENRSPAAAARWILAQRPDVVVLLEAAGRGGEIARALAPHLPYRTTCRGDRPCSTLIVSRVAPVERHGLARGDADNRKALSAALVRFGAPLPPFALLAVHLSRPLPVARQAREIEQLAAAMAGQRTEPLIEPLIVTGDFNAPGWSMTMRRIADRLAIQPLQSPPSWPANLFVPAVLAIDHTLLGPGWAAARIERGPALGSDHHAFTITVAPASHDARN